MPPEFVCVVVVDDHDLLREGVVGALSSFDDIVETARDWGLTNLEALHAAGFEVSVETNGTIAAPPGIDWLCVSPKGNAALAQQSGDELKLVYPQPEDEAQPARFESLEFDHFYLQPLDDENCDENTRAAIDYCLAHPRWQLSLQAHKILGID